MRESEREGERQIERQRKIKRGRGERGERVKREGEKREGPNTLWYTTSQGSEISKVMLTSNLM